jgi:hypothetical protein
MAETVALVRERLLEVVLAEPAVQLYVRKLH